MSYKNRKIAPMQEYRELDDFYTSGAQTTMPDGLYMLERLYEESWRHLRKGVYTYKKIGQILIDKFPEYELTMHNARKHVANAAQYYAEKKAETKDLHRARLLDALYKQKTLIEETYAKFDPYKGTKLLQDIIDQIAKLTGAYKEDNITEEAGSKELVFVLHDDARKVPGLNAIPEARLIREIDAMAKEYELTESEKNEIIDKDVRGALTSAE